jgi:Ca2+-binding RTX toxin-like protein
LGTVTGTSADDIITGSMDGDLLSGLGGADEIYGGASSDIIDGGADNDLLFGENGDDTLYGGLGNDILEGGAGKDVLRGGDGDDVLSDDGGSGDSLFGDEGNDALSIRRYATYGGNLIADGGSGDDRIWLAIRTVTSVEIRGGSGDDLIEVEALAGGAAVSLGEGQDTLRLLASAAGYQMGVIQVSDFQAGAGGDRIDWFDYLDARLTGWDGAANPFGASGFVRLVQNGGATELQVDSNGGGNGFATVIVFANTMVSAFSAFNLGGFPSDGSAPGLVLNGTGSGEIISGGIGADFLNGLGGSDQLYGGGGNDVADGGADNDEIYGQDGNDTLTGGIADDVIDGGDGNDELHGGEGDDVLTDDSGATDTLYGEGGNDSLVLSRTASSAGALVADGGSGDDSIWIALRMAGSAVTVNGGSGMDVIRFDSLAGQATITLGDGMDSIRFDQSAAYYQPGAIVVTDFGTGVGGDTLDWSAFLGAKLGGWSGNSNPFAAGGWLRLEQAGADVRLQIDSNGGGDSFATFITFQNTLVANFTQFNFGGLFPDGSAPGQALNGTAGGDIISGGIGGDTLSGLDGGDQLYGGGGADTLNGDADNDFLFGEAGNDLLFGGAGVDALDGGAGSDELRGGDGNDLLSDDNGSGDRLYGEEGDDRLTFWRPSTFANLIADGGAGDDRIWFSIRTASTISVTGGTGNDSVEIDALAGTATISLGAGQDVIRVFASTAAYQPGAIIVSDFEVGANGDRIDWTDYLGTKLSGWNGASNPFGTYLFLVQSGADTLLQVDSNGAAAGGLATLVTFQNTLVGALTAFNLGGLRPDGSPPGLLLVGTPAVDALNGGAGHDVLYGLANDDQIVGGAGDDVIDGGAGADSMTGGTGNDFYLVDNAADLVIEAAGGGVDEVQTALGSAVDYTKLYHLPGEVEKLTGTAAGAQGVWANASSNVIQMGDFSDLIVMADSVTYTAANAGNDIVHAGGGSDYIFFGGSLNNADTVNGGAGYDTLGLLGGYSLTFEADDLFSIEKIGVYSSGNAAAPYNYALNMHDSNLAAGVTMSIVALSLLAGEALVFNGAAELDGSFKILAGRGGDIASGGARDDYLSGGDGSDALYGLGGSDFLIGGAGSDTLNGGGGIDLYFYMDVADSTAADFDHITNFKAGGDSERIDLKAVDANSLAGGNQAFAFIGTNAAFSGTAGELRVANVGSNWFVQGDVNGDAIADLVIQIDNGGSLSFAASDFYL